MTIKQVTLTVVIDAPGAWTDEQVWEELKDLVNTVIEDTDISLVEVVDR